MEKITQPMPQEGVAIDINAALATAQTVAPTAQTVAPTAQTVAGEVLEPQSVIPVTQLPVSNEVFNEVSEQVKHEVEQNEDLSGTEIASVDAVFWKGFLKVLEIVSQDLTAVDIISINKGKLVLSRGSGILSGDLTDVFGTHTWHLKDPGNILKKLKLINGGDRITIMDADSSNIIYNVKKGEVNSSLKVTKTEESNSIVIDKIDPGELKHRISLDVEQVIQINKAKKTLGAREYNVIIDVNTHELLSIDINSELKFNFLSSTGRETMRYKVSELFPVPNPENNVIFEIYQKDNDIFFKTLSDLAMTTIHYQIYAIKNEQIAELEFDSI